MKTIFKRKALSLLLTFAMVLSLLPAASFAAEEAADPDAVTQSEAEAAVLQAQETAALYSAEGAVPLAEWNFTTMTLPPLPPTTPPWETTLYATGGADSYATLTTNATNGWGSSPSNFLAANGFDGEPGEKYWQVDVPIGMSYEDMTVNVYFRTSGSITNRWYVQYRTYGSDKFVDIEDGGFTVTKSGGGAGPVDWDSGLELCPLPDNTVAIRFVRGEESNPAKPTASGGNAYINNIIVMGVPTQKLPQLAMPTAEPAPGRVLDKTELTLASVNDDVVIRYSTSSADPKTGDWEEYDPARPLTIDSDTHTFYAYVTDPAHRQDDSEVRTFSYEILEVEDISAIRAHKTGTPVMLQGTVSHAYPLGDDSLGCYVQDATGGILVVGELPVLAAGDTLTAAGILTEAGGRLVLTDLMTAEKGAAGEAPAGTAMSAGDLGSAEKAGAAAGTLVSVADLNVDAVSTDEDGLVTVKLSGADGGKVTALLDGARGAAEDFSVILNDTVTATGIVDASDSGWCLRLLSPAGLAKTADATVVAKPIADRPTDRRLGAGEKVRFSCPTPGAAYESTADLVAGSWEAVPAEGLVFPGEPGDTVTLHVRAVKEGMTSSEPITLTYLLKPSVADQDPIPDSAFTDGILTIPQLLETERKGQTVTVLGQLTYRYSTNSGVFQDVINGETVSLIASGSDIAKASIGDVLKLTFTLNTWSMSLSKTEKVSHATPLEPQAFDTFADLLKVKEELPGAVVLLKNVTLPDYNSGSITVKDSQGKSLTISKPAAFPVGIGKGDVADLVCAMPSSVADSAPKLSLGSEKQNAAPTIKLVGGDTRGPNITLLSSLDGIKKGESFDISVQVEDYTGVKSVSLVYTVNGKDSESIPLTAEKDKSVYQYTIPSTALNEGGSFFFTITAVDTQEPTGYQNVYKSKDITIADEPLILTVSPRDGEATLSELRPTISVTFENAGETPAVKLTLTPEGGSAVLTGQEMTVDGASASFRPAENLAEGKYNATVTVERGDNKQALKTWSFSVGEPTIQPYFGQLHSHTGEYSDGAGFLSDALDYVAAIPEADNVQFVAFTDHSNYFDNAEAYNPAAALGDASQMTAESKKTWDAYRKAMTTFNNKDNGRLAIAGFEMTWAGGPGHMNTFNSDGLVSRNNPDLNSKANKTKDEGMQLYYAELSKPENAQTVSQFNHPGTMFGAFTDFAHWDPAIDSRVTMVEVGNGEGQIHQGGYYPSYEYYVMALDKGWHVAPTNNQDNHKGAWGNANDARTVIYTDNFSVDGLLDGMRDMSMYATEDKNLEISYYLNGSMMGSILETPDELHFTGAVQDPDPGETVGTVQIVANGGRVVYETVCDESTFLLDVTLEPQYNYYFLKVIQPDKDVAVTAPVWVGESTKAGITSFSTDAPLIIEGESIDLTAELYNYDAQALVLDSIEYSLTVGASTTSLSVDTDPGSILSQATMTDTFTYTPAQPGLQTITLTVNGSIGNTPCTFTSSMELEVIAAAELTSVAIDTGHGNAVVTDGSETELPLLAGLNNIRLDSLGAGELTYENLSQHALVLLSMPADGSAPAYTDTELDALRRYAADGGSFLVAAAADRTAGSAASAEANRVLEAIGATARIGEATVVDEVRNTGLLYRVPLTGNSCFNYDATAADSLAGAILSGVNTAANNTFNLYSGAPVLPGSATVLVRGFKPSTKSVKADGLAGDTALKPGTPAVTAPGSTVLMAAESLAGGGFVVTSGSPFFATKEMYTDIDKPEDKQNANYWIMQNILGMVQGEVQITSIADVHKAPEGRRFTVEGIATTNASGYDKDTAFFDCIYLQDETGGINLFPVSDVIQAGQRLRVTGYTSSYQGERQLAVRSLEVVDAEARPVAPKSISTMDAALGTYLGTLVKVEGVVVSYTLVNNLVETIIVRDGSGYDCRIFIDGYITKDIAIENLAEGHEIAVVGLSSYDNSFDGDASRIRVPDRSGIVCGTETVPIPPVYTPSTGGSTGGGAISAGAVKEGADKVTVAIPSAGAVLSQAAEDKLISLNAEKPVVLEGAGLSVTIPAGTLSSGADVNAMLVNPKDGGNAIRVTHADGTASILPFALVGGGRAAYIADRAGTYAVVDNTKSFPDVDGSHWAADAIGFVASHEIFNGMGDGSFSPAQTMTRSMVVTALYRMANGSAAAGTSFADVPAGAWYADAVSWAAASRIVEGDGRNFNPDAPVTREQLCTILARYMDYAGFTLSKTASSDGFADMAGVSPWAADAVRSALETGLLTGKPGQSIDPQGQASRAEIAVILQRFVESVLK